MRQAIWFPGKFSSFSIIQTRDFFGSLTPLYFTGPGKKIKSLLLLSALLTGINYEVNSFLVGEFQIVRLFKLDKFIILKCWVNFLT
jgi:hypothetical protein